MGEGSGSLCTPACSQGLEEGLGPAPSLHGPVLLPLGRPEALLRKERFLHPRHHCEGYRPTIGAQALKASSSQVGRSSVVMMSVSWA